MILALLQYFQFKAPSVPRVSPVAHQVNETAVALECTVPKEPPGMESTIGSLGSIVHDEDRSLPASSVYSKSSREISLGAMCPRLFSLSSNGVSVAGSSRSVSYEYTPRSFSYPPVVAPTLTFDWLYGSIMSISRRRQDEKSVSVTIPSISSARLMLIHHIQRYTVFLQKLIFLCSGGRNVAEPYTPPKE